MHRLLIAALVVLLASSAHAGGNPDARIYIDFDPPNYVHEFTPELYTEFSAYVYLDQLGEGMTAVSFRLTNLLEEYPGVCAPPGFISLLPGGLIVALALGNKGPQVRLHIVVDKRRIWVQGPFQVCHRRQRFKVNHNVRQVVFD